MDIGFSWESAEPADPKDLADKVMNLIKDKNLFIGICTGKEAVINTVDLSRNKLRRKLLNGPDDRFSSKTSDWIIQEIEQSGEAWNLYCWSKVDYGNQGVYRGIGNTHNLNGTHQRNHLEKF
jgi:hypothetical protein